MFGCQPKNTFSIPVVKVNLPNIRTSLLSPTSKVVFVGQKLTILEEYLKIKESPKIMKTTSKEKTIPKMKMTYYMKTT